MNLKNKRKIFSYLIYTLMTISVVLTLSIVLFITLYVLYRGLSGITLKFLTTKPSAINETVGILPEILNTLYVVFTTVIIVIPLATAAAIYVNEYGKNKKLLSLIERATETLAAIPSIIYGLVGMLIFSNNIGSSLLAGSLTLVIMNLPIVLSTVQESLKTVDDSYRQGAYALAAGKFTVVRTIVIPGCIDGIVAACILTIGRIISESAALLYTAGIAHIVNGYFKGMKSPGATLTVSLYVYAKEEAKIGVAFNIAAVLIVLVFIINGITTYIGKKLKSKGGTK